MSINIYEFDIGLTTEDSRIINSYYTNSEEKNKIFSLKQNNEDEGYKVVNFITFILIILF